MPTSGQSYHLVKGESGLKLATQIDDVSELNPNDVLMRVHAVSINFRDLMILRGPAEDIRDGLIPLSDAAGTIAAVGSQVTRWKAGDRASPIFFAQWQDGPFRRPYLRSALGGGQTNGVLGELIVVPERSLVAVPESLSLAEAATLPCAAVTAWHGLIVRGNLKSGDTVLIQGTGGVAIFALQLAVAVDAKAIVLSSSDLKLERAKALGAWGTINYKRQPDWDKEVHRLTDNEGVSHVLELGGPETYERSISAVAAGGQIVQIGVLSGFGATPNLQPLQSKNASILGICVGSGQHHSNLSDFVAARGIKPVIDREFSYDEAPAAYAYLQSAMHFGKIVINMNTDHAKAAGPGAVRPSSAV